MTLPPIRTAQEAVELARHWPEVAWLQRLAEDVREYQRQAGEHDET